MGFAYPLFKTLHEEGVGFETVSQKCDIYAEAFLLVELQCSNVLFTQTSGMN